MKRSPFRAVIAVVMAIIMASLVSVNAFAATTTKYITDIVVATGSSLANAKRTLTQAGYTPVSYDLNSGNSGYVAIGVKTSTDKSKAITDISIMNMNGGYSFQDYENTLKEFKETADNVVNDIFAAVEEYRAGIAAENPRAQLAQRLLNQYTDEDFDNKGLGDILADSATNKEQLSVIFMQANTEAVAGIETMLALAVSSNWLNDFVNYNPDGVTYTAEDYNKIEILHRSLSPLKESLLEYDEIVKASGLDMKTSTEEQWKAYAESLSEDDTNLVSNYSSIYNTFKAMSYGSGTLYDFFTQDLDNMTDEMLLPLVKVLTPGQLATFPYASAAASIQYAISTDDYAQQLADMKSGTLETISVFAGVDRSIFEADGIALTDEALRECASTNDTSWYRGNLSKTEETVYLALIGAAAGIAAIGAAVWAYSSAQVSTIAAAAYAQTFATFGFVDTEILVQSSVNSLQVMGGVETTTEELCTVLDTTGAEAARGAAMSEASNSMWGYVAGASKIITGVAIAVVLILVAIYLIREYKAYLDKFDVEYTRIPRIIVNKTTCSDNTVKYTYYYAAKYAAENTESGSEYADINNWKGSQWLAIYYTKDINAGDPITNKILVSDNGSYSSADYSFAVHTFGQKAAYNLNTFGKSSTKIYMYAGTSSGTLAATAMNYGYCAITAAAGLIIGAVCSFFIARKKYKKSPEKAEG